MNAESARDQAPHDNDIQPHQIYGLILTSDEHSHGLPRYLLSTLERRGENMARISATMPQVLVGLHHIWLTWDHALRHTVRDEVASIVCRMIDEIGILVDAILANHHAPVNAAGRSMLEAWALLRLFADNPEEIASWGTLSRVPGNTEFNFSKVLRRIDEYRDLSKGFNAPELSEYNAHSLTSHVTYSSKDKGPAPGTYLWHLLHFHDAYRHTRDFSAALAHLMGQQPALFQALPDCPLPCPKLMSPPAPFVEGYVFLSGEVQAFADATGLVIRERGAFEWKDHPLVTAYVREQGASGSNQRQEAEESGPE